MASTGKKLFIGLFLFVIGSCYIIWSNWSSSTIYEYIFNSEYIHNYPTNGINKMHSISKSVNISASSTLVSNSESLYDRYHNNKIDKSIYKYGLRRGIMIYEPNNKKYVNIFSHFLYNSWMYILRVQHEYKTKYNLNFVNIIDIILVIPTDYNQFDSLPYSQCKLIQNMTDKQYTYLHDNNRNISLCIMMYTNNSYHNDSYYVNMLTAKHSATHGGYKFLNSLDCILTFKESYPKLFYHYDYILKTDDDVFLTPFFLYKYPKNKYEFIVGKGGYIWKNSTRVEILNITNMLNLTHCWNPLSICFNLGSSWYGSPKLIYEIGKLAIDLTVYLIWLFDNNYTAINNWNAGWYRGVASMYASELAVNNIINGNKRYSLITTAHDPHYAVLDFRSSSKIDINSENGKGVIHIHTWQTFTIFSKWKWQQSDHKECVGNIPHFLNETNRTHRLEIRMYCCAIASLDLHLNLSVNLFDIDELLLQQSIIDWQTYIHHINKTELEKQI
eukprot:453678_1